LFSLQSQRFISETELQKIYLKQEKKVEEEYACANGFKGALGPRHSSGG
jgi:hypothetical protein